VKFPTIVYKTPGNHRGPSGTYDYAPAKNQSEFDLLIEDGWYATLPEAFGVSEPKKPRGRPPKVKA